MLFSFSALSYQKKSLLIELICLFILCVVIPFSLGSEIWPEDYSFTLSLIFLNTLQLPATILFYRWLLPFTFGRKRYARFFLLLPFYLIVYEINARLASITVIHMPFIPDGYRSKLASAHPENFSVYYINQSLGYTCLVLLSAGLVYMIRQTYRNQYRVYTLENEKLKLELGQLKSQLQPHFFFNTLNNLYALSTQGSPKTAVMIVHLSEIMRYVLYDSQQDKVSLDKEVHFIRSYIELEKIRHNRPDCIDFALQGNTDHIQIAPLLFLPFIENAFKHSLANDMIENQVRMILAVDEAELSFQVSNPLPHNSMITHNAPSGGIGLRNVKKRLELLYPGTHQLHIDKSDGNFTVFLNLRFSNT
jgi:two-component system LytT family sensor kinase